MTESSLPGSIQPNYLMKHSFQPADHEGWILLDGRAVSTLPAGQQANAIAVGLTTNLPTSDLILREKGALWSVGGTVNPMVTLTANHIRATIFNAVSNNPGNTHTHATTNGNNIRRASNNPSKQNNNGSEGFGTVTPTLGDSGAHQHKQTLEINPNPQVDLNLTDAYLSVNHFIYLGD